jgi:enoyl-[acyl-carrier protein] reductase II
MGRSMTDGALHLGGSEDTGEVDPGKECYPAGQGVGSIDEIVPAGELVRRIVAEADATLDRLAGLRANADA